MISVGTLHILVISLGGLVVLGGVIILFIKRSTKRKATKQKYKDKILYIVQRTGVVTNERTAHRLKISLKRANVHLSEMVEDNLLTRTASSNGVDTYILK